MTRIVLVLLSLSLGLSALTACNPKTQVGQGFVGKTNKVARYIVTPGASSGSGDDRQQFYNYYIEVCDFDGAASINCKKSLVLENIDMGPGF